ncbi:uncharacterized, partial [Tachysurus ichikawai]
RRSNSAFSELCEEMKVKQVRRAWSRRKRLSTKTPALRYVARIQQGETGLK